MEVEPAHEFDGERLYRFVQEELQRLEADERAIHLASRASFATWVRRVLGQIAEQLGASLGFLAGWVAGAYEEVKSDFKTGFKGGFDRGLGRTRE